MKVSSIIGIVLTTMIAYQAEARLGSDDHPIPLEDEKVDTGYTRIKEVCDLFQKEGLLRYSCDAGGIGDNSTQLVLKEPCSVSLNLSYADLWDSTSINRREKVGLRKPTARGVVNDSLQKHMVTLVKMFGLSSKTPSASDAKAFFEKCGTIKKDFDKSSGSQNRDGSGQNAGATR